MKLRNKKTGEIGEFAYFEDKVYVLVNNELNTNLNYTSLAKLNEEWEDYEEPEEDFWYIDSDCETYGVSRAFNQNDSDDVLFNKSIGNYFETKEEAEKAVEKLKALKRLKDRGFRFVGWQDSVSDNNPDMALFKLYEDGWETETCDDLDLLFGGEE